MLKKFRDWIVRWKFRIGYLNGFLTTFAAVVIISTTLQDKLIYFGYPIPFVWILLVMSICVIFGAYLLDKFGVIESEVDYANTKNRLLNEIGGKKDGSNN